MSIDFFIYVCIISCIYKSWTFSDPRIEPGPIKKDLVLRFLMTENLLFKLVIRFDHMNADVIKLVRSIKY